MLKRCLILLTLSLLLAFPAAAQEFPTPLGPMFDPLSWMPEDITAVVQISDLNGDALSQLNRLWDLGLLMEPERVSSADLTLNNLFPVGILDVENATFQGQIFPWLRNQVVIGYTGFGTDFIAGDDEVLLILPSENPFAVANALRPVIERQDNLTEGIYRGVNVYRGDRATIALHPSAALVGSEALVRAALDVQAGEGESLAADPMFQRVRAAVGETDLFVYAEGQHVTPALSFLASGDTNAAAVYTGIGRILNSYGSAGLTSALLTGRVSAVGIGADANLINDSLRISTYLLLPEDIEEGVFDRTVLASVPRNAAVLQSGMDSQTLFNAILIARINQPALYSVLTALPVYTRPQVGEGTPMPSFAPAAGLEAAIDDIYPIIEARAFDLETDVFAHVDGGYTVALIPRPNNPVPLLELPVDWLIILSVDEPEPVLAGLEGIVGSILNVSPDDMSSILEVDGTTRTVPSSNPRDPVIQFGEIGEHVVIGSGQAFALAERAYNEDNRLIDQPRWQDVQPEDTQPTLYVDFQSFHNTFVLAQGQTIETSLGTLAVYTDQIEPDLYVIEMQYQSP